MSDIFDCIVNYHQQIKTSLFVTGFTLGSFLFSMKSMIIKTMKEEIYDQKDYQDDIYNLNELGEKVKYYESLEDFSNLLYRSIVFSFISAIVNITLGIFPNIWIASSCLLVTVFAWCYVGRALYFFQSNWSKVFEYAENKANTLRRKEEKKKLRKEKGNEIQP